MLLGGWVRGGYGVGESSLTLYSYVPDAENRGTMRNYRDTTQRQGQPQGRTIASSSMGRQLASLFGIEGLAHLNDDEVEQLVELLRLLEAEGFRAGWAEALRYNADVARLTSAPGTTSH